MDVWIEDARKVKDAMVCTVVFGTDGIKLLMVKDTWVRKTNDGSKLWFKAPEKPRVRNGEPVMDDKGYPVRDEMVSIYLDPTEKKPTKPAFKLKDQILAAMQETWDGLTGVESGVGSASKATARPGIKTAAPPAGVKAAGKPQRPAGMGAARPPAVMTDVDDDDDDDSLPF